MDQLAGEFAGMPVVFLEYDVDQAPSYRYSRWWAAFTGSGVIYLPLVMVDSGNQISNGYVDFLSVYRNMVNTALARPPKADVQAGWWRNGDKMGVYIQVTNLSGVNLSASNAASLHVVIYEDAHVKTTDRFVRSTIYQAMTLANNATASYLLESQALSGVDWGKLHAVVLVDYRPGGMSGAYDMLQAAMAEKVGAPFAVYPESPAFMVETANPFDQQQSLTVVGPGFVQWTAMEATGWFSLDPLSGTSATRPVLTAWRASLSPGWQEGSLSFATSDGLFTKQLTVRAYVGEVFRAYLPFLAR